MLVIWRGIETPPRLALGSGGIQAANDMIVVGANFVNPVTTCVSFEFVSHKQSTPRRERQRHHMLWLVGTVSITVYDGAVSEGSSISMGGYCVQLCDSTL